MINKLISRNNDNNEENNGRVKRFLNQDHDGVGGLYFLTVNIICAVIMLICLQLSWDSEAIAISDNLAYITSINTTVNSYVNNKESFTSVNPSITKNAGGDYSPLNDFNSMLAQAGISRGGASSCKVTWDKSGRKTTIQFSEITTNLNTKITPHRQESIIEDR